MPLGWGGGVSKRPKTPHIICGSPLKFVNFSVGPLCFEISSLTKNTSSTISLILDNEIIHVKHFVQLMLCYVISINKLKLMDMVW